MLRKFIRIVHSPHHHRTQNTIPVGIQGRIQSRIGSSVKLHFFSKFQFFFEKVLTFFQKVIENLPFFEIFPSRNSATPFYSFGGIRQIMFRAAEN